MLQTGKTSVYHCIFSAQVIMIGTPCALCAQLDNFSGATSAILSSLTGLESPKGKYIRQINKTILNFLEDW